MERDGHETGGMQRVEPTINDSADFLFCSRGVVFLIRSLGPPWDIDITARSILLLAKTTRALSVGRYSFQCWAPESRPCFPSLGSRDQCSIK